MSLIASISLQPPTNDACCECESTVTCGVIDVTPHEQLVSGSGFPLLTGFELAFCQRCRSQVIQAAMTLFTDELCESEELATFLPERRP